MVATVPHFEILNTIYPSYARGFSRQGNLVSHGPAPRSWTPPIEDDMRKQASMRRAGSFLIVLRSSLSRWVWVRSYLRENVRTQAVFQS